MEGLVLLSVNSGSHRIESSVRFYFDEDLRAADRNMWTELTAARKRKPQWSLFTSVTKQQQNNWNTVDSQRESKETSAAMLLALHPLQYHWETLEGINNDKNSEVLCKTRFICIITHTVTDHTDTSLRSRGD